MRDAWIGRERDARNEGEETQERVRGGRRFWEENQRRKGKGKGKKERRKRKKERKERKERRREGGWSALVGGHWRWPELAGEGGQSSKPKQIVGCKCS